TKSAIWAALPKAILTLRSRWFLRAAEKAATISAAAPTRATTMKPTKAGVIPKATAASCTEPTKISLTKATKMVTPNKTPTARPMGQAASVSSDELLNNSGWVLREKRRPEP